MIIYTANQQWARNSRIYFTPLPLETNIYAKRRV